MDNLLTQIKEKNKNWFSPQNKRMFGDKSYYAIKSPNGKIYLVRSTYAWTDMFDQPKRLHYRINEIKDDLEIGHLVDEEFTSLDKAKAWIKKN